MSLRESRKCKRRSKSLQKTLQEAITETEKTELEPARRLVNGLADEYSRWTETVKVLKTQGLTGDQPGVPDQGARSSRVSPAGHKCDDVERSAARTSGAQEHGIDLCPHLPESDRWGVQGQSGAGGVSAERSAVPGRRAEQAGERPASRLRWPNPSR